MTQYIWLDKAQAKCQAVYCRDSGPCARRDIGADGRPIDDYSRLGPGRLAVCESPHYIWRILPSKAVKPAEKLVVKDNL